MSGVGTLNLVPLSFPAFVIPRHPVVTLTGNTTTAALTPDPTLLALTLHDWRTQLTTTTPGAALTPQPTEAQLT
jgi:hypothetical protein